VNLSASEIRVLGCLLEKQRTTPDQYPLSLNALRLACNQSTNRDPVVEYDESVLRDALHRLERRGYTRLASGAGSRAAKYRHLLAEALPMAHDEQAVICVLMLRGPQTPGELKQRTDRMHPFGGLGEVHETLERLIARELVACLGRRPGQKEDRFVQLLQDADEAGGETAPHGSSAQPATGAHSSAQSAAGAHSPTAGSASFEPPSVASPPAASAGAILELTERVARLELEVAQLRAQLGEPSATEVLAPQAREDPPGASIPPGVPTPPANGLSQR
jgi:uncharacterized protein